MAFEKLFAPIPSAVDRKSSSTADEQQNTSTLAILSEERDESGPPLFSLRTGRSTHAVAERSLRSQPWSLPMLIQAPRELQDSFAKENPQPRSASQADIPGYGKYCTLPV